MKLSVRCFWLDDGAERPDGTWSRQRIRLSIRCFFFDISFALQSTQSTRSGAGAPRGL